MIEHLRMIECDGPIGAVAVSRNGLTIAAFENHRYLSPEWRPNLLASTVFILHGTQMDDNPAVQASRAILNG